MTEQATLDDKLDQLIDSIDGLRPLIEALARNAIATCNPTHVEWLTTDEAAARLQISRSTLYYWRYHGGGPPVFKIGRFLRYDAQLVDAWGNSQGARP